MLENLSWAHILVLLIAGLFILGPERLPQSAAWLGRTIRQVKDFASGTREQLRQELGPEFEQWRGPLEELRAPLRELRNLDPRKAMVSSLFDDQSGLKPNGYAPPPAGAGALPGPTAAGLTDTTPADTTRSGPAPSPPRPLSPGERPPIDPDAT